MGPDIKYGAKQGQIFFKAFDVYERGNFWGWEKFCATIGADSFDIRIVPIVALGLLSNSLIENTMNGPSLFYPGHMREGVVLKPIHEMTDLKLGRVILKAVSPEYLAKAK